MRSTGDDITSEALFQTLNRPDGYYSMMERLMKREIGYPFPSRYLVDAQTLFLTFKDSDNSYTSPSDYQSLLPQKMKWNEEKFDSQNVAIKVDASAEYGLDSLVDLFTGEIRLTKTVVKKRSTREWYPSPVSAWKNEKIKWNVLETAIGISLPHPTPRDGKLSDTIVSMRRKYKPFTSYGDGVSVIGGLTPITIKEALSIVGVKQRQKASVSGLKELLSQMKPKVIADPFSSWGECLLASALCPDVLKYIGLESDTDTVLSCQDLIGFIAENKIPGAYKIVNTEASQYNFEDLEQGEIDMILSSFEANEMEPEYLLDMTDIMWHRLKDGGHLVYHLKDEEDTESISKRLVLHMSELGQQATFRGCILMYEAHTDKFSYVYVWYKSPLVTPSSFPLYLERLDVPDGRSFILSQDAYLPGGSMQRATRFYSKLKLDGYTDVVAYGSATDSTQCAVAIMCKETGLNAHLFIIPTEDGTMTDYTVQALRYGAIINLIPRGGDGTAIIAAKISEIQSASTNNKIHLLSGFVDDGYITAVMEDLSRVKDQIKAPRIWFSDPTGLMSLTLRNLVLESELHVLCLGGKAVKDMIIKLANTKVYESQIPHQTPTSTKPPYESNRYQDSKLWEFILRNGKTGDMIWNSK